MKKIHHLSLGIVMYAGVSVIIMALADDRPLFENDQLKLLVIPRSPNQMAGFYEARGFPERMIDVITDYCFMTVVVHNKTKNVIWLKMDNWKFVSLSGAVKRIRRHQWPSRWEVMNIPMASQSTFRWTLLPESLELFPGEHEGGNVVLMKNNDTFSLQAGFFIGKDASEGSIVAHINKLQCAKNNVE